MSESHRRWVGGKSTTSSLLARGLVQFSLLVSILIVLPLTAAAQVAVSTGAELTALEKHLFSETFPTDTVDQRLGRLDKFVFGRVRLGSDDDRLKSLMIDVPSASDEPDNSAIPQTTPVAKPTIETKSVAGSIPIDYPTVSALENEILGHTEENLPLEQRLANLELKAFGKASAATDDLAIQVDKLKSYELNKNGGNDDYLATASPLAAKSSAPVESLSISNQLTLLEKTVFAKTYSRDGIISRLDRLEKAVYPSKPVQTFSSVPARVDRLMDALQITNANSVSPDSSNSRTLKQNIPVPTFSYPLTNGSGLTSNTSAKHHSFWHKVASVIGGIGQVAAMSMASSMYGGYPGYGYGYGGGGMFGGYGGMNGMYGSPFNRGMY